MQISVNVYRQGSKTQVNEYPSTESDAIRKYFAWARFYSDKEGITIITLKLPGTTISNRVINGVVSILRGGEFYADPNSYKRG